MFQQNINTVYVWVLRTKPTLHMQIYILSPGCYAQNWLNMHKQNTRLLIYLYCIIFSPPFSLSLPPLNCVNTPTVGPPNLEANKKLFWKNISFVVFLLILFLNLSFTLGKGRNFVWPSWGMGSGGKSYHLYANFLSPLVTGRRDISLLNPNEPIVVGTCSFHT